MPAGQPDRGGVLGAVPWKVGSSPGAQPTISALAHQFLGHQGDSPSHRYRCDWGDARVCSEFSGIDRSDSVKEGRRRRGRWQYVMSPYRSRSILRFGSPLRALMRKRIARVALA